MQHKSNNRVISSVFVLLSLLLVDNCFADLILTAPPRENSKVGQSIYGPLAEYISQLTGESVIYTHPGNWLQYSVDMRKGKYDIVFDGPHFAAWRIKHLHHLPVAKLPGTLDFLIIAHKSDSRVNNIRDLVAKKVCGLASPNLGTVTVIAQYSNPVLQPVIWEVKGGFGKVYNAFMDGRCRGAVIRDNVFKKLTTEKKNQIKILFKSIPLPNQTVTVSRRVDDRIHRLLSNTLTSKKGVIAAGEILSRFSRDKKYFIPAKLAEYDRVEKLLEGIWGW